MSPVSKPTVPAGRITFELERFELADGDRYELHGRWFGVRGRRFMRPALTVVVDGRSTRLLADLAGKPWAAEDGEPWDATFPRSLQGEPLDAELTVAPDITVKLPLPGRRASKAARGPAKSRTRNAPARSGAGRDDGLASLASKLSDAEAERRRLERELERSRAEKVQVEADKAQAAARMDELLGQLGQVARERDEAQGARDQVANELEKLRREHRQVTAELAAARRAADDAQRASETAVEARDRALAERGAATRAQARAESERDAATAAREKAATEREGALALRDHALAERDAAIAARDDAVYQRDALSRTSERLQSELSNTVSDRGAALVMRWAAQERVVSRRNTLLPVAIVGMIALVIVIGLLIALQVI